MLTGFDSKWINTLYLDKMLQYENLIQAFSRTNRLFGDDKQFGTIKYYRRPHTMEKNIADAVKEYSGDKPFGLFVDKLDKNVEKLNALYAEIKDLFVSAGIEEFSQIPADIAERKKFADLFQSFNENLEAAKVQGFEWDKPIVIINEDADEKTELHADFDERTFKVLALRYKELFTPNPDGSENDPDDDVPYAVNSYLTTIDTADIDTDYMNSRFEKYLKIFYQEGAEAEAIHQAETELHKTFATLSQEEQKYANIFLHDIQSGAVVPQPGKTLREYIAEYIAQKQNDQIYKVAEVFGLDEKKLRAFMIQTRYEVSNNAGVDICSIVNNEGYDFLLVGSGISMSNTPDDIAASHYRASFYNRYFKRFKAPESWFYPGALLKDKTKMFIEQSNCPVGVFVNRNFVKASNVIVVIDSEEDLFLLGYAQTLLKSTHGSASVLDKSSSTTPGNEVIKEGILRFTEDVKQTTLLREKDLTPQSFNGFNFMLISYKTWNDVSEHRKEALQKMPSTLILSK